MSLLTLHSRACPSENVAANTARHARTGTLQNYARKHKVAIDTLKWDFKVRLDKPVTKAEDGCYIDGLFIDGGAWDHKRECVYRSRDSLCVCGERGDGSLCVRAW